jgi:hypothetical protein
MTAILVYAAPVVCVVFAALALGYYEFCAAHKRNGGNE